MKMSLKRVKIFVVLLLFLGTFCTINKATASKTKPLKIACVGNSITYGLKVENRKRNAYPAQLQEMLGANYNVQNFGISSRTLLTKGNKPYIKEPIYKEALAYKPDLVFIKLGSNDAKAINRIHLDDFETDYKALIASFKQVNPKIRIVLVKPIPSFHSDTTYIWESIITNKIIPKIEKVAYDTQVEIIDMHQLFIDKPELLVDKIHPSSLGATLIARRLYESVVQKEAPKVDVISNEKFKIENTENFYGYNLTNFQFNKIQCKIVTPKKVAPGNPWVLRARFFGHEPQTDIALLERGFHIAYCDVANLYGNNEAISRWDAFYNVLTALGLSKKVVLEGMSRGGLPIYNWVSINPDKVAGIYADAPVLNAKSWPGSYKGSRPQWNEFKQIFKLVTEADSINFKGDPIHKTEKIAKAGFPMLHVCGLDDEVVPVKDNTEPFVKAIRKNGGNIKTIYKENNKHHPHSLKNPTLIVEFILRATGQKLNLASIPAAGAEYRSGAGWSKGTDWWTQAFDIDSLCQNSRKTDILFIGNSITQGWGGGRPHVPYAPGKKAMDHYFKELKVIGAGISGDRTQNVLWRLNNGKYEDSKADYVVVAIGVNNFLNNDSADEISEAIAKIVNTIKVKFLPKTEILLFGPLPTGTDPTSDRRKKYESIHQNIKSLDKLPHVTYCNPIKLMTDEKGFLKSDLYSGDGIHLKGKGYMVWGQYISKTIKNIN